MARFRSSPVVPSRAHALATTLWTDRVSVEVLNALGAAGVRGILLRGPSIARHLYGRGEGRLYVDADILVAPRSVGRAERVLADLGFSHVAVLGQSRHDRPRWSSTWVRPQGGGEVDLHWTVAGANADPAAVWDALQLEVEPVSLLNTHAEGLNDRGTALVVALHAAHHGVRFGPPLADLERAVRYFPLTTWTRAAALAERIAALEAFATGLRLVPSGVELAQSLGLPAKATAETILRASTAPPMALGFDWLEQTPGLRRKARLAAAKLVPDRAFMRAWFPPARQGSSVWLALGYAWRPLWLAWHAGPGLRAWRKARRVAREPGR